MASYQPIRLPPVMPRKLSIQKGGTAPLAVQAGLAFGTALLHCLTQGTRTGHPKHDTLRNHEIDEHGISENYICIILQIDWQVLVKDTLRLILI